MTRTTILHRLPNALMYDDVCGQQTRTQRRDGPPLKDPLIETNGGNEEGRRGSPGRWEKKKRGAERVLRR